MDEPIIHSKYCLPPGFSLPAPSCMNPIASLVELEAALQTQSWFNKTTIAIKASVGEKAIFDYQHHADGGDGTDIFNKQIRIASVTKVFTVLAVLLSEDEIKWNDCITKFVPGLNQEAYADVTIGALASQTSGLGRFGYVGDLALIPGFSPAQLGLPDVPHSLPGCDAFPGGQICSRSQVVDMFNHASYLPSKCNSGPLYSNITYNLLGIALENVHSKSYEQIIQDLILDPIGMRDSTFETPATESGAVLPQEGDRWWAAAFGNFNPSGGMWSTPNDMLLFLEALQSHRLLTASKTRKWMQPSSLLPSLHQLVGAPWEIFRPTDIDLAIPRPIDLYTKAGGLAGYSSHAVLVPEYGIALTIHAAGDDAVAAVQSLLPLVIKPLISSADEEARTEAQAIYTGTYRANDGNSSVELALDDGPGLRVKSAVVNGVHIIPALAMVQKLDASKATARLYPQGQESSTESNLHWRLMIERLNQGSERGFAEQYCASWNWTDTLRYASEPLDKVIFSTSGSEVVDMQLAGWRMTLRKVITST